ncbi:hypothetical protein ACFXC8_46615 [Streptomyces sp. NPDC059441]|uniref:hypothetical protein n=1 Tax=Streptomyces sp. NPDC059441 TaxID=3346829 RepID=UPI003691976A
MNRGLVLVEPGAHRAGGHRHGTLTALAAAHGKVLVLAQYGVAAESAIALEKAGARVTGPVGRLPDMLAAGAVVAERLAGAGRRAFASRSWPAVVRRVPHQVTLLARCLVEAACVRTAHRLAGGAAVVVLSASEALHAAAGLLGGSHIRFVHEVVTAEGAVVRLLGRLAAGGGRRVVVLAPTDAVRDEVTGRFPGLRVRVRPFAVADPGERLSDAELRQARDAFGIPATEAALCLVGGWCPYKDIAVVDNALAWLDRPLNLLVAGAPLDQDVLDRWAALPAVRLHVVPGPASQEQVRAVYAADAALVARRPGVGKESGLVVDAVRLGVPLLLSDHDPALTVRLTGQDWVQIFPAGDGARLAALLCDLAWAPPPRPAPGTAAVLGVPTAAGQAGFLTRIVTESKDPQ